MPANPLASTLADVRACRVCEHALPLGPRPVLRLDTGARVLIIGQAPGAKVHASGVDWDDASGVRLRDWLGVSSAVFYSARFGVMPMGFCYPGRGASGDLPPRPECAPLWHPLLLPQLRRVRLTLLVGAYAQHEMLGGDRKASLTDTVRAFEEYLPRFFPLPHPSPRNAIWQRRNPWFDADCLPALRRSVAAALA
ncbi:MAG: uracil-DNA glycosylase family protein [Dehalococcoidia bacterium]|nr:uracil-DNA glycosylase family protein [Dehalococcoidia bacterium]